MSSSAGDQQRAPLTIVSGHSSQQGVRPSMEDEVVMKENFTLSTPHPTLSGPLSFYGVFDGHGGRQAAIYTRDHLFHFLTAELEAGKPPTDALRQAFLQTDSTFIAACRGDDKDATAASSDGAAAPASPLAAASPPAAANPHAPPPINTSPSASAIPSSTSLDHDTSGTTAVAVLLCHASHTLYVAHVGDSRAIVVSATGVSPLTSDHKADRPDEVERIRAAGGFVVHKRVMGELAISRAIGDMDFKRPSSAEPGFNFVVADPEVGERAIRDKEDVLVLACDGLYDVMTNQQVAEYVRAAMAETGGAVQRVAESIVSHAIEKLFTRDNVTVIIVHMRKDGGKSGVEAAGGAAAAAQDGQQHHAPHIQHAHHHSHHSHAQQQSAVTAGDSQQHHAPHKHHSHPHHHHHHDQQQQQQQVQPVAVITPSAGTSTDAVQQMQADS